MKKVLKSKIFIVIICGIIFKSLGVYGATKYNYFASEISYTPIDGEPTTVNEALDEIYNIKSLGDATEEDIVEGKTAVVNGKLVIGKLNNSQNEINCFSTYISSLGPTTHQIDLTQIDNYENLKVENMVFDILNAKAEASGTAGNGMGFSISYDASTGIAVLEFSATYYKATNITIKGYFKVFY